MILRLRNRGIRRRVAASRRYPAGMRSKLLAVGAACAVVAFAGLGAGCSSSEDDSASETSPAETTTTSTGPRSMTIRVLATVTSARPVDLPPRNAQNKGDRVFVESQLRNAVPQFDQPKGSIVGVDYSTITYLSARKRLVSVQITLPGGGLRLRGTIRVEGRNAVNRIPVISGTRDFEGATGFSEVRSTSGSETLNVYRLRLP